MDEEIEYIPLYPDRRTVSRKSVMALQEDNYYEDTLDTRMAFEQKYKQNQNEDY